MVSDSGDVLEMASRRLAALGDPVRARQMAAYMRTDMPFYGVQASTRREVLAELLHAFPVTSPDRYEATVRVLWRGTHREEKYLAIDVAIRVREFIGFERLGTYQRMIVEGAWWDLVDPIATKLVGTVLLDHPKRAEPVIAEWGRDVNLWLRRTALICRIRHKKATDAERLFELCAARAGDDEFFIRKAIGWALREYAKTDPKAVTRFLRAHRDELAPLSFREAAKHLALDR